MAPANAGTPTKLTAVREALEVVVNDDFLERTVETIVNVARSGPEGTAGDGKIFIVPAEEAIQVDAAARGPGAV